jgi:uncharacterized protein (TIGR02996 family)
MPPAASSNGGGADVVTEPTVDPRACGGVLAAVAAAPGQETPVRVLADWLDDHDDPAAAAAIREYVPELLTRCVRATGFLTALRVAADTPAIPQPVVRAGLRRREWVALVRAALRPFRIPSLTVAASPGWGSGWEVELRYPPGGFALPNGRGGWNLLPWCPTWQEMDRAARTGLDALMARLFPDEPERPVHFDGETDYVRFWRVTERPAGYARLAPRRRERGV